MNHKFVLFFFISNRVINMTNFINPNFPNPSNISGLTSAKGDLIAGLGSTGVVSLSVGSDGQSLIADSGEVSGLRWGTSTSSTNLQDAYDNSTGGATAEIVVDGTRGAVTIRDNATPIGANLFEVQNNGSTDIFSVDINGATIDGKLTVTGLIDPTGMVFNEQATIPQVPAAGEGTLWVRNDNPNVLVFRNDAGTDIDLDDFSLQRAYNDSSDPEIILTTVQGGLSIRNSTTNDVSGNLFEIQNNAASQTFLGVTTSGTTIDGNLSITGDLTVDGTTITANTETINVASNFISLNQDYDSDTAMRSGLVSNTDPNTGSQTTVAGTGFTAGVAATSNPTVDVTAASGTFSDGDIVIITGANEPSNNGLFEVLSHAANVLTIRGVGVTGNTSGIDFVQDQFDTDTTVAGTITLTDVSILRARTDGEYEIGSGSDSSTINSSFRTLITQIDNSGGTETLISGTGLGPTASTKGLSASTGISLSSDANSVTITNTDPASGVTLTSAGGSVTLVDDGVGPDLAVNGLTAGTGINLGLAGGAITITNSDTGSSVTLSSAGGTISLVDDGVGPDLAVNGLTEGTGITLGLAGGAVTVTNSSPATSVTLTSAGGTETLVNDGTGPAIATKGITAGTGISLSSTATALTITNDDPASSVTLSSAGGTVSLVDDGVGPDLAVNGLTAGTGISLGLAGGAVTVTNSSPATSVTLSSAGGTETLVVDGTGPSLSNKGLTAGTGINLTGGANDVTITNTIDTFVELSDTPANYTGSANQILVVNSTPDAVIFSENVVGTNTDTSGSSLALCANSTVGSNTGSLALGINSTVSTTNAIAFGQNTSNDSSNTFITSSVIMVNNTSSTATTLGISIWPGAVSSIVTDEITMTGAPATYTITLPTNTRMFVQSIDVIKTDAAATVTGNGDYTLGGDAGNSSFVGTFSIGGGGENVIDGRQSFMSLGSLTGTNTLIFDHTTSVTVSAGTYNVRVAFHGMLMRSE